MARKPIIGISGSHDMQAHQILVRENYFESVLRAGGIPVLLPEIADEETAGQYIGMMDGLLLAGGGDMLPARYGEEAIPECGAPDDQRDVFELLMIPMALKCRMPVFGICRGVQVLSVALGGALIQDIQTQCGIESVRHNQEPPYSEAVHTVHFAPDSIFARITGGTEMQTNSMHHQAVRDAGPHLRVDGKTPDGIIEAVSGIDNDRIFAVQFHPEYLSDHDEKAQKLFDHFVALARAYQHENGRG